MVGEVELTASSVAALIGGQTEARSNGPYCTRRYAEAVPYLAVVHTQRMERAHGRLAVADGESVWPVTRTESFDGGIVNVLALAFPWPHHAVGAAVAEPA